MDAFAVKYFHHTCSVKVIEYNVNLHELGVLYE